LFAIETGRNEINVPMCASVTPTTKYIILYAIHIGRGWLGDGDWGVLLFARYSPRAGAGSQFQKRDCIHFTRVSKLYAYNIYIYVLCIMYA